MNSMITAFFVESLSCLSTMLTCKWLLFLVLVLFELLFIYIYWMLHSLLLRKHRKLFHSMAPEHKGRCVGSCVSSLVAFGWSQTSNWVLHQVLSVAIPSHDDDNGVHICHLLWAEAKNKQTVSCTSSAEWSQSGVWLHLPGVCLRVYILRICDPFSPVQS